MIAVIEKKTRVVWGVGTSADAAMSHARREIAQKPRFQVGPLELATLAPGADLDSDGEALWPFVMTADTPMQNSLF